MKKINIFIIMIVFLGNIGIVHADLAENVLKVNLIKYDPYPVTPDSDFSIWIQVKNTGDTDVRDSNIEFIPKYPFTIKSGESSFRNPGIIRKNDDLILKFIIHADKNAIIGTNKIDIGYRIGNVLIKNEFDIEVGNDVVDAKGTVKIEKYTVYPQVVMPGDIATIVLTVKNSASQYTIKMNDKDYSLNAQVQSAELIGNDAAEVKSGQYYNVGIIAPGDSIDLSYTVKVKNNIPDGTYYLDFNLKGSARLYSLNLKIPLKVDSSNIETTVSTLSQDQIILNVANNRPNTIYAVKIFPTSISNITLEPSEYFIGTMDSDEMFTAKFDIKTAPMDRLDRQNIKFSFKFKNGDNWHTSDATDVALNNSITPQSDDLSYFPIGIIILLIIGLLIFKYRKKK